MLVMLWLGLRLNFDSTDVRRLTKGQKVIKVTMTYPASYSHDDLLIYLGHSAAALAGRPTIERS